MDQVQSALHAVHLPFQPRLRGADLVDAFMDAAHFAVSPRRQGWGRLGPGRRSAIQIGQEGARPFLGAPLDDVGVGAVFAADPGRRPGQ